MKSANREFTYEFDQRLYLQAENIVRGKDIEEVGFQEVHDRVFLQKAIYTLRTG